MDPKTSFLRRIILKVLISSFVLPDTGSMDLNPSSKMAISTSGSITELTVYTDYNISVCSKEVLSV